MLIGGRIAKKQQQQGMSLVEVLASLAIVALMYGVFAVSYRVVYKSRAKQAAQLLLGDMRYAQQKATFSGRTQALVFRFSDHTYTLIQKQDGGNIPPSNSSRTVKLLDSYVRLKRIYRNQVSIEPPFADVEIRFYPDGMVMGPFTVCLEEPKSGTLYSVELKAGLGRMAFQAGCDKPKEGL